MNQRNVAKTVAPKAPPAGGGRAGGQSGPPAAPPSSSNRRTTLWVLAVIALVVIAVGAIAFALGRGDDKVDAGSSSTGSSVVAGQSVVQGPVTVTGNDLPVLGTSGADPAVGMAFPDIKGVSTLDGTPVEITNDGKPKLIFVVAHWCPHCQKEVPLIQKWIDGGGVPEGVELYAVSTAVRPDAGNYPPAKWLTGEHWTVPTIADSSDNAALTAAGVSGFPFIVAVDKDGNVVARTSGEQPVEQLQSLATQLTS